MINLKENIEDRLWNFIKRNYLSENYSNAILDSIQFIGDIIREKSGLEGDGSTLVGSAFGGENPKVKLNKLQTDSEKNLQKGIEHILRGIYSAYRNPRSHSKIDDSEQEANEIILFINHLIKIIDRSKGKFSTDIFLQRIFDTDFVQSNKYSEILVNSIPPNKNYEVAVEIYKQKNEGPIQNIKYVWKSLFDKLSDNEKNELYELVSEELRFTDSPSQVTRCIALFDKDWEKIDEDSRLRAENKIINLIPNSEKNIFGNLTNDGVTVTWLTSIIDKSLLKNDIASKLEDLLQSRNSGKQRFALEYFGKHLKKLNDYLFLTTFDEIFIQELQEGNELFYNYALRMYNKAEKEKLQPYLDNFKAVAPKAEEEHDDLPF